MNQELEFIARRLTQASSPEDVFGEIKAPYGETLSILQQNFRTIAKVTHPDMYHTLSEQILAQKTFTLLNDWLEKAKEKIALGEYGQRSAASRATIQTRNREYSVEGVYSEQPFFNVYPCRYVEHGHVQNALLKVVRDPHHNELAENEVRALQTLVHGRDGKKFSPYIPNLLDAFVYESDGTHRQALIFEKNSGWYSLEDVHNVYSNGIDPKDMAWMWRRLLVVLGFSHVNRVIHGAVLPRNILILPDEHGLMLLNWHYAVRGALSSGESMLALDDDARDWYPADVLKTGIPSFGTDIQMSAKCMIWLLGGDPHSKVFPNFVPAPIRAFLKGCILPGNRAPQNAWQLKEEFDELLGRLWGKRKFHPFIMK